MRVKAISTVGVVAAIACVVVALAAEPNTDGPTDPTKYRPLDSVDLTSLTKFDLRSLHRITEKPHLMSIPVALRCTIGPIDVSVHRSINTSTYCHVYANDKAKQPLLDGKGSYPEGAYIVKQKLTSAESTQGVLYTEMLKREQGYDPEHNDWEYVVRDGAGQLLARGKIESCIECHASYRETDYVTRAYIDP